MRSCLDCGTEMVDHGGDVFGCETCGLRITRYEYERIVVERENRRLGEPASDRSLIEALEWLDEYLDRAGEREGFPHTVARKKIDAALAAVRPVAPTPNWDAAEFDRNARAVRAAMDRPVAPEDGLDAKLAVIYRDATIHDKAVIARICDKVLDPRGALLGRVRDLAVAPEVSACPRCKAPGAFGITHVCWPVAPEEDAK